MDDARFLDPGHRGSGDGEQDPGEGDRVALGSAWPDSGLMFTKRDGAVTLALAAGTDMQVVQAMLRHSSITITADTYTSVLPELARGAAEKTAAIVPRRVRPATPQPDTAAS